jgi:hypothetical protein
MGTRRDGEKVVISGSEMVEKKGRIHAQAQTPIACSTT